MAASNKSAVLRHLRVLANAGTVFGLTDGQLLERYLSRDVEAAEPAFAALVQRHGPMVLRVCRAVLHDPHLAEDAFQATFLVLARRAGSIRKRDSATCWLHGVARRVSLCARAAEARRRVHELRAAESRSRTTSDAGWDDLAEVIHEELSRLPERYRMAVVVCDLEGLTEGEASSSLGWPLGTVRSRLARGRERMRKALSRRGVTPTLAPAVVKLSYAALPAKVPDGLATSTVRAALRWGVHGTCGAEVVPAAINSLTRSSLTEASSTSAATLAQGALYAMLLAKLKGIGLVLAALALAATGVCVLAQGPAQVAAPGITKGLKDLVVVSRPNTVEIGASHGLLLPWVFLGPKLHGGHDSHATGTMHAAAR